ncbi:hypothetical protein CUMW_098130 [Citrus unshiu]|uniref:Uncharacterized protein n=1 Tax=Citrus unshiu TaxID=55188 RepID=A0A2H5P2J1_CITUN|nr:hypothetical protein CUMW_098130 [Citrus unshiu]
MFTRRQWLPGVILGNQHHQNSGQKLKLKIEGFVMLSAWVKCWCGAWVKKLGNCGGGGLLVCDLQSGLDLRSNRRSAVSMGVKTKKNIPRIVQWNQMASSKINFAEVYSFLNDESRLALFQKLMSPQLLKLAGQEGVRAKLKKWEETLKTIEAVLIDAEEKQLSDRAVKLWLDDLRDLAYDAEDILDEFAAEAGLRLLKKHEASSSTFRSLIQGFSSGASSIMAGISTRSKMEEISSRLEELCERRTDLGLEKIAGGSAHTAAVRQRPPTTCLTSEPAVYGRDTEKARSNVFEKVRHSSYVRSGDCDGMGVRCDGMNKFKVLDKVENLRTFLPIFVEECFFSPAGYISPMVISDLLPKCKKLRVLSLGRYRISEVPTSIGCLKHLRYLNFSESWIKCLPEAITSLFNLEILILSDCRLLLKLPSSIGNLVNLYHLDIDGANRLCELPLGMKELKCLRTLTNFIVGKDSGCALKDLKNWKFLRGRLCISGLENVIDSQEANEAMLRVKKDLEVLKLEWRARRDGDSVDELREKNILDMLKPHGNIKRLVINSYGGTRFPSWIGDPSFSNVAVLILKNCRRSTSLPSLGQLCSLKDLTIVRMSALKGIGSEIYGECCSKPFPSLQTLYFEDLQVWEKWEPNTENDEHVQAFPHLRKLFIHKCPKLSGRLPNHLPSLEKIVITECRQLVISLPSVPALCKLKIDGCKRLVCDGLSESKSLNKMTLWNISEFENWSSQKFQNVEHLEIVGCEGFVNEICLGKPLQGLHSLTCLKDLLIGNCPTFVSLPKVCFLSNLRKITIEDCCALTSLTDGMIHNNVRLEVLRIKGCHSLTSISRGQLPSSLKSIDIRHCETLQCVLDDRENSCTSSSVLEKTINSSSTCLDLESLSVFRCPLLTCLWTGGRLPVTLKRLEIWCCYNFKVLTSECQLPVAIEELTISNCSNLESIAERFYDDACLRSILISSCDNLKSLPKGLNNLSHLHRISIEGCHNLVSLPEDALPSSVVDVSIEECDKLKGPLPTGKISSLQELSLKKCPGIVFFPEEGLSTNLTYLEISGANIYKPLVNWGWHKLTSLRKLCINGCSDAASFPEVEKGVILPTSLTWIRISDFPKLERLSSKGFHYLVSLEKKNSAEPENAVPNLVFYARSKLSVCCYLDPPYEYSIGVAVRWLMVVLALSRNEFRYLVLSKKTTSQLILSYFIASECTNEVLALPYILKLMKGIVGVYVFRTILSGSSDVLDLYHSLQFNMMAMHILICYSSLQRRGLFGVLMQMPLRSKSFESRAREGIRDCYSLSRSLNETEIPRVGILNDTKCAGYVPLSNNILTK